MLNFLFNSRLTSDISSSLTPPVTSGLILDVNAKSLNTGLTAVSTWSDTSASGISFTQGTGTNQPTYTANIINGQPAVLFDGTNDWMQGSANLALGDSAMTIFSILRPTNLAKSVRGGGYLSEITNTIGNDGDFYCSIGNNAGEGNNGVVQFAFKYGTDDTDRYTTASGEIAIDTNYSIRMERTVSSDTKAIYINNTNKITSSLSFVTGWGVPNLQLGRTYAGVALYYYQGYIGQLLAYNRILTAEEITAMNTYIFNNWGV
jgi:hypothetical protein